MTMERVEKNGVVCAVIHSDEPVFTDADAALDVLLSAKYDLGTKNIVIDKVLLTEKFFSLSNGLAEEIVRRYVNYGGRMAIYGDYSQYSGEGFQSFMRENNREGEVLFVATREEAIKRLTRL